MEQGLREKAIERRKSQHDNKQRKRDRFYNSNSIEMESIVPEIRPCEEGCDQKSYLQALETNESVEEGKKRFASFFSKSISFLQLAPHPSPLQNPGESEYVLEGGFSK
eukprot:TRINITY_DN1651_c0_g2_i1.p2 TRINITY_DN1651_c0_g2~~TRINITY_DN1651_c0_g2_i1.p2  ORF type:complete len:108 (+),score=11.61 TRINITY_DN1651_c0_g2_i1:414-737(+)